MIEIKIVNSEVELHSLPITQSITLSSNTELDTSLLHDHIILFRTIPEKGLISLVEPYSYTAGFIKEKFTTTPLHFQQTKKDDTTWLLDVKPSRPLELDSDYILYITKNVLSSSALVEKTVSKSNLSSLQVSVTPPLVVGSKIVLVKTTSKLSETNNIVTFTIGSEDVTMNLKQNLKTTLSNITYYFRDTVYVQGESFLVTFSNVNALLTEDILYKLRTAPSTSITPIQNQTPSSTINTQDVLNFYQQVGQVKESISTIPKYVAPNIFSITLPEGFNINTSKTILMNIREAFNNYLLSALELYKVESRYKIYIYQEESELYIEVIYQPEEGAVTEVVNDLEEPLTFKVKRMGL